MTIAQQDPKVAFAQIADGLVGALIEDIKENEERDSGRIVRCEGGFPYAFHGVIRWNRKGERDFTIRFSEALEIREGGDGDTFAWTIESSNKHTYNIRWV